MNQTEREEKIVREEQKLISEEKALIKEEKNLLHRLRTNLWVLYGTIALVIVAVVGGILYYKVTANQIYIDKSDIEAPLIELGPHSSGILEELYVKAGDMVKASAPVARVGNELIKAKIDGEVIATENSLGKIVNPGESIVTMIDPGELHAVGQIDEDKGLSDVRVGQVAVFTVDAFGSQKFSGVVDEISPTSRDSGVVFSISDKREVKQFDIKVRFDASVYTMLANGMSARIWIYK